MFWGCPLPGRQLGITEEGEGAACELTSPPSPSPDVPCTRGFTSPFKSTVHHTGSLPGLQGGDRLPTTSPSFPEAYLFGEVRPLLNT